MCNANPGDKMEIVTDQVAAFQDLKEYLSEQGIGSVKYMMENG